MGRASVQTGHMSRIFWRDIFLSVRDTKRVYRVFVLAAASYSPGLGVAPDYPPLSDGW